LCHIDKENLKYILFVVINNMKSIKYYIISGFQRLGFVEELKEVHEQFVVYLYHYNNFRSETLGFMNC